MSDISQSLANVRAKLLDLQNVDRKLTAQRATCAYLQAQVQTKRRLIKSYKKRLDRLRKRAPGLEDELAARRLEVIAHEEAVGQYSKWLELAQSLSESSATEVTLAEQSHQMTAKQLRRIVRMRRLLDALPILGRSHRRRLKEVQASCLSAKRKVEAAKARNASASKAMKTIAALFKKGQRLLDVKTATEQRARSLLEQVRRAELQIEEELSDSKGSLGQLKALGRQARDEANALEQRRTRILPRRGDRPNYDAQQLSWEVLPPGWWRDPAYISRLQTEAAREGILLDINRLVKLASLSPRATYRGWYLDAHTNSRRYPYHVFEFEAVAIADCQQFGNALYYAPVEDWREVFVLTKREALRAGARRLIHRGGWFERVQALVYRGDCGPSQSLTLT